MTTTVSGSGQQSRNLVGAANSASSSDHSDHHSELTDTTPEDENFIALLQYKDAYHVLNLSHDEASAPLSPEKIQIAYDTVKEQVLVSLEEYDEKDKHANGRNMFFVSQQNYLELKLQALDQAYEELMPTETTRQGETQSKRVFRKNEAASSSRTEEGDNRKQTIVPQHLQRKASSGEELDTIDIYFRPSPGNSKSSDARRSHKSPDDHASDSSWDGSSIFSMVSNSGLSDVLGPIYDSSHDKQTTVPTGNKSEEDGRNHRNIHRPPSGSMNSRPTPKAQISPKSVTDFPASIQNQNHYDNASNFNTNEIILGRGKMMKESRSLAAPQNNSHEAAEAARMGILRALSEDNSVCLPLEDALYLKKSHSNSIPKEKTSSTRNSEGGITSNKQYPTENERAKPKGFFQGKSDPMPKETNSLAGSEKRSNERQIINRQTAEEIPKSHNNSSNNRPPSPKSLPSSTSSSRRQHNSTKQQQNNYNPDNGALQTEEYTYDAIFQSGMDFAEEFCMTFGGLCWKGDSIELSRAESLTLDDASNGHSLSFKEEEYSTNYTHDCDSTYQSQSVVTHGDLAAFKTYHSQSVATDGDSTAFNTQTSFSRNSPDDLMDNGHTYESSAGASASLDSQPRMLV
mmetsp:Transcript_349/g.692  ORF Transcript_349/g.692 Transcript_349/m.692 type:complete len:628 (+) Transcript_349:25-1908(+)